MIKTYEMTKEQLETILEACKPTLVMYISGGQRIGGTPQENANSAWAKLGREMGFQFMTVKPLQGGTSRQFTAETLEATGKEKAIIKRLVDYANSLDW